MSINHRVSFAAVALLLLMSLSVFSQNARIDSLKSIIETKAKDTAMISTLNELSSALIGIGEATESSKYSKKAKQLATELDYTKGKAYALKWLGIGEFYQGNFVEVDKYLNESLENFEILQDSTGIANILNNLGTVLYSQGRNAQALEYYLRSLRIAEKLNNPMRIASALVNVAAVYAEEIRDYEKTMSYYNQAIPYLKILNDTGISKSVLLGIGQQYFKKGEEYEDVKGNEVKAKENYENALKKFEEALPVTENSFYYVENLILIGQTLNKLGKIDKAIEYLDKAHKVATENDQRFEIVKLLVEKGNIYKNTNSKKAINMFKEAELMAKDMKLTYELKDIYEGISQAYINKGDFKNGYEYQVKYVSQKDSIFNVETDDKVRGLQFDFDLQKKEDEIGLLEKEAQILELNEKRQKIVKYITFVIAGLILLLSISLFRRYKYVRKTNRIIEEEKNRSENLLLNILPEETALELKENGKVQAKKFDSVTVLFTDFEGFTRYADNLSPEKLVETIDFYFSKFDEIVAKYDLEKIKTIGDAYMCAGGLPFPTEDHAHKMILAAFEIAEFVHDTKKNEDATEKIFDIRIGVNTGPVVSGVVGSTKFAYDIWGDTVNVASRMESMSELGKINISESTYNLVKDAFECEYRGEIKAKNRGKLKMYFVNKIKEKEVSKAFSTHKIDV